MMDNLLQLKDKNIVVMGVANDRSIAWGIAKRLFDVGANVIFTYRQERSLKKLQKQLENIGQSDSLVVQCDVNSDDSTKATFDVIGSKGWRYSWNCPFSGFCTCRRFTQPLP